MHNEVELGGIAFCTDDIPCDLNTAIQLNTGYSKQVINYSYSFISESASCDRCPSLIALTIHIDCNLQWCTRILLNSTLNLCVVCCC